MAWLIVGIVMGGLLVFLTNNRYIKVSRLDWALIAVAMVFFALAIANYTGSMDELEPRAAGFMLLTFGVPGLVLVAIASVRVWRTRTQLPAVAAEKSS